MIEETIDSKKNENPSMMNLAFKWALIIAFSVIVIYIIVYLAGSATNKNVGWINYALMLIGASFATKVYRDEKCGGYISFGRAFQFGFLTVLIVGIITTIYSYFFFTYIAPELVDQILKEAENNMLNSGQSEEQIELAMSYMKKFMTPGWMAFWGMMGSVFLGAIISLLSAAIMKKENKELQPPA
ncbi:hypothetical protein LBMAG27_22300 [Bacteroidota bacterium]|nr:hypothetical protein LBMAG27_22300 [Bacteroidota bacterium]